MHIPTIEITFSPKAQEYDNENHMTIGKFR